MKDKIINLVGASGSGKTTIAKELDKLGYNIIHSYTTRAPREENEWGHTFVDSLSDDFYTLDCIDNSVVVGGNIIAYFNDYEKNEEYWATREQYQGKGTSIYVVDPKGAEQVHENVKDAEVITVFLVAEERERRLRMASRKMSNVHNTLFRAERDREIFKVCKCDYVVDANRKIEEVLQDVIQIIGGNE